MATDKPKEQPKAKSGAKKKKSAAEVAKAEWDKEKLDRKEREAAYREKVEKEQASVPKYKVAAGKSVTTKAGMKNAGEVITVKMLHQGKKTLARLLELKAVEEVKG